MLKRGRMRFPRPLSSLINEGIAGAGMAERLREADIWRIWPEVVGSVVASRAQPLRIIGGTLTVAVSSAPWMQELRFLTGMIKEKLNNRLGKEVVKEIILKPGKAERPAEQVDDVIPARKKLTSAQSAFIEELSAPISDPEIRRAFADLMKASMTTNAHQGLSK